ncbi:DUF1592 domain-containing protein [Luteolibacter marinus]|uniref:DUF1592 domain-containing protein n=1 Tax=Luteolibacter marinus TaxID=2776705 RepID=UPI001865F7DE|nr:DUF1592 domain-containing protein [Luteolibacter marinus]
MSVRLSPLSLPLAVALFALETGRADELADFEDRILPILEDHCYNCHGDGAKKGKVAFDSFGSFDELTDQTKLWDHALRNVRAGIMPPPKKDPLSPDDLATLVEWIKRVPLKLDPANPDPGRVTLRRLNRIEYRNTVRELTGHDFRTDEEFPADDTGYGFDNIGDVLTTSPLLLEKYMQAAETIVEKALPLESRITPKKNYPAGMFRGKGERGRDDWHYHLSLYDPADLTAKLKIGTAGTYRVTFNAGPRGSFSYDPGRARVKWSVDGKQQLDQEVKWGDSRLVSEIEVKWQPGEYALHFEMEPLVGKDQQPPDLGDGPPYVHLELGGITLTGPLEPEHAVHPPNYDWFFTRERVPDDEAERDAYRREILGRFAKKAFRRPADDATVAKLAAFAKESAEGASFEKGIARAVAAILASPRFLFRLEDTLPADDPTAHPLLDEWSLASRLSYFLWSTMPDEELFRLAERGELRTNLPAQIDRMLNDGKSDEFVRNFAGQWLQARDVEGVSIDARAVIARDSGSEKENRERFENFRRLNREIDEAEKARDEVKLAALRDEMQELRAKFRRRGRGRVEFGGSLRHAMKLEAEMLFRHLLREDRSVLELIDNDSTFLNEELANHYGVPGVRGGDMKLVKLPDDSPRGGVLTMGTVLAVTSNPTRTSPVKRGVFILDNILGTPPPPAPPNIPSLEASEKTADGEELSLREALAMHREKSLCASCHNRMDPLGLAFENFNALGSWRDKELGEALPPVDGQLITGEKFTSVNELKRVLVTSRREDFYRCITEKLLTYALGRGPEPCDITTVDEIVADLDRSGGKFSTLITGIIESPAFQKRQRPTQ